VLSLIDELFGLKLRSICFVEEYFRQLLNSFKFRLMSSNLSLPVEFKIRSLRIMESLLTAALSSSNGAIEDTVDMDELEIDVEDEVDDGEDE